MPRKKEDTQTIIHRYRINLKARVRPAKSQTLSGRTKEFYCPVSCFIITHGIPRHRRHLQPDSDWQWLDVRP